MTAEEFGERATSLLDVVVNQGFERPISFACIAMDGRIINGSYGLDDRVVIDHPGESDILTPIIFSLSTPEARHNT